MSLTKQISSRIIFSHEPPREGIGTLLHFEHEPVSVEGWVTFDIRKIVKIHEDEWLLTIESWHRDLSVRAEKLTRWWWLIPGSRLILWETITPFSLKPILFALAVIKLYDSQPEGVIWVVGAPNELVDYLSDWMVNEKFENVDCRQQYVNARDNQLLNAIQFYLKIAKNIALLLTYINFRRKIKIDSASVIVSSTILDANLIDTIGDHFFGKMLDDVKDLKNQDVVWLYNDIVRKKQKINSKLTGIGRRAYFIVDHFCFSDLWFALCEGLKIHRKLQKILLNPSPLYVDGVKFLKFHSYFTTNLVLQAKPIFELAFYRQFKRVISESGASVLIYPYEEKTIERAMLMAVKDQANEIRTIGFAHAAYSKGHLYIRRGKRGEPPRPDFIAVTGDMARKRFESVGVPREEIIITGSPRHHNIMNNMSNSFIKSRKKILFIVGLGFELRIFAALICNNKYMFDKYDLHIRRSYHSWLTEQDIAENRMQAAGITYKCENGDLMTQIDESDIVLFEATSAGFEAVLRGKLAIRLDLSDIINTNHFEGTCFDQEIEYCSNSAELVSQLENISLLTPSQYMNIVQRQRMLVERLFSPVDNMEINNLLRRKISD